MPKEKSKSQANSEQLVAIEHSGGFVLQAGAGSGKTFVLTEHFFSLLSRSRKKLEVADEQDTKRNIRHFYNEIALMTFTKKATSEIRARIFKKVKEASLDDNFYKLCLSELNALGINTIHGFCSKLLGSGNIDLIPTDYKIVSDIAIYEKISKLFKRWYRNKKFDNEILGKTIAKNLDQFVNNFVSIFSQPELRLWWSQDLASIKKECWPYNPQQFLNQMIDLNDLQVLHHKPEGLDSLPSKEREKTWEKLIEGFYAVKNENTFDEEGFAAYLKYFNDLGRAQFSKAEEYQHFKPSFEAIKKFKKVTIDLDKHLNQFFQSEEFVSEWFESIHEAVSYIEKNYLFDHQYSFSDLEFYLLSFLRSAPKDSNIYDFYRYYIIDEFQDTSWVQFEIIERLVKKDFSKVFFIGDIKQAIYGFRGGELGVFQKSLELVPQRHELAFNYRSHPAVIHFNNSFFASLFSKSMDLEGTIENPIAINPQAVPDLNFESQGEISELAMHIQSEEKSFTKSTLDQIEAEGLMSLIEEKLATMPEGESICVLYPVIAPSDYLLAHLLERKISFSAQAKIPNEEDPIYCFTQILLQFYLAYKKDLSHVDKMIEMVNFYQSKYFLYLNLQKNLDTKEIIKRFYFNLELLGLLESLQVYFLELGLANSNSDNNLKVIKDIMQVSKNDISRTFEYLQKTSANKYKLEFINGQKSRITIMTVHGSKGLQFTHVFLAGLHGHVEHVSKDVMGTLPFSFKYKVSYQDKNLYQTPWYIAERFIEKQKSFAESKRLFYVACTRAEKSLAWVRLCKNEETKSWGSGSWIRALDIILTETQHQIERKNIDFIYQYKEENVHSPIFHLDRLGLARSENARDLILMADVSVTSLSTLSQCPRKFYLRNICKLDADYFGKFTPTDTASVSSIERGNRLHKELSLAINRNYVLSRELHDIEEIKILEWVLNLIKAKSSNYELISEKEVKFSFFNHMISGIPDLVLKPKNQDHNWSIWDFKSGHRKAENEDHYWFQLMTYAYAYSQLFSLAEKERFTLTLCYLDEEELVTQEYEIHEVTQRLFDIWSKARHQEKIDDKHCRFCEYHNFCH